MCYITSYDSVLKYGEILGVSRLAGFHENISLLFVKSKEISPMLISSSLDRQQRARITIPVRVILSVLIS